MFPLLCRSIYALPPFHRFLQPDAPPLVPMSAVPLPHACTGPADPAEQNGVRKGPTPIWASPCLFEGIRWVMVALRAFSPQEIIERCPVLEVGRGEARGSLAPYAFPGYRTHGSAPCDLLVLGHANVYRSARGRANVWYYRDTDGDYVYKAAHPTREGGELVVDYGWDGVGVGWEGSGVGWDGAGVGGEGDGERPPGTSPGLGAGPTARGPPGTPGRGGGAPVHAEGEWERYWETGAIQVEDGQGRLLAEGEGGEPWPLAVAVGPSAVHGRGVFATRAIAELEVVEVCPVVRCRAEDVGGVLRHYAYSVDDNPGGRQLALGLGMMYNSSPDPSLATYQDPGGYLCHYATRDVRAGEELFIDYGEGWWAQRKALSL